MWNPPASASPYLASIRSTEQQYGMPPNLLARLLYQESRFRPEIINGSLKSHVGATGIAQVMPATAKDPGFGTPPLKDPTDPFESIRWAGSYLVGLKRYLGSWNKALAGYNWGPGYVAKAVRLHGDNWRDHLPHETSQYVTQIDGDVEGVS